ncbi:aminoglycoside 3'-phosphotransferase [Rugosimonospora acidiphila]|uniref:Aminoglycoside 3'-phosphotransferase n=1 Tax=Rugosimonospora acidiphila TaxID=556531 RepID=A0ABP9SHV7_9ACTN
MSGLLSGPPPAGTEVPAAVARLAASRPVRPVWRNQLGGLTFEIPGGGTGDRFVKWAPAGSGLDLGREATRLRWARPFTPVPRVVDEGADEHGGWLVTEALPGDSAVVERWRADPGRAVDAIATGLRRLHDALPVDDCPFSWSAEDRLAVVARLDATGRLDPARWHSDHSVLGRREALARVSAPPPVDRLVVCHGDPCAPNTLIGRDGTWLGHVDLGSLGRADRWADLAVATWSLTWNYGPGWDRRLLDAYGVEPDLERTAYYRLLWDLGP